MFDSGNLLFHFKLQSLSVEILKVLSLEMLEHLVNVSVSSVEEDFPVAEVAN